MVDHNHNAWSLRSVGLLTASLVLSACLAPGDAPALEGRSEALKTGGGIVVTPIPPVLTPLPVNPKPPGPSSAGIALAPVMPAGQLLPPGHVSERLISVIDAEYDCPPATGNWEAYDLFPGANVRTRDGERFCAIRWTGSSQPNLNALPRFRACKNGSCDDPSAASDQWLGADDKALFGASFPAPAVDAIASALRTQHRTAMANPDSLPTGGRHFARLPMPVKVYVLDNSSEDEAGVHGDSVADWVRQSACPGEDCGIWINKRSVFDDEGAGSVLLLAQRIVEAVQDARGWPAVINLSLQLHPIRAFVEGYNPVAIYTTDADYKLKLSHMALLAALNYAYCNDIAVISAAGNRDGEFDHFEGNGFYGGNLAYPAAFGGFEKPWACGGQPQPDPSASLVYAAGGIDAFGRRAVSVRPGGQGCLAAPSGGMTPEGAPLEGTSFSAAALTAAAANVSRYAPFLKGWEVMKLLWETADMADGSIDNWVFSCAFEPLSSHAPLKRVNMCKAVNAALASTCATAEDDPSRALFGFACDMEIPSCPLAYAARVAQLDADGSSDVDLAFDEVPVTAPAYQPLGANMPDDLPSTADCGSRTQVFAVGGQRNDLSCPMHALPNGAQTGDGPGTSPGHIGCGGCSLLLEPINNTLWFIGTLEQDPISSPTVRLGINPQGATLPGPRNEDRSYEVTGIGPGQSFAVQLATGEQSVPAWQLQSASFSYSVDLEDGDQVAYSNGLPLVAGQ